MTRIVGGLDEVGWGACAGPVISVVAVFRESDYSLMPPGVKDSKKTTETQRDMLYFPLLSLAYDVGVGWAWPWEVDVNPSAALKLSYKRALEGINPNRMPEHLIVDGVNRVDSFLGQQVTEPKADVKYWQVSAASIIAKVFRDTMMKEYAKKHPQYGWDVNKGYGTDDHRKAIQEHGLLINSEDKTKYIHRQRYCRNFIKLV